MRGGIDLGGTKIQAVVIDARDSVVGQARLSTPKEGGPADVAAAISEAVEQAATAAEVDAASHARFLALDSPTIQAAAVKM